MTLAPRFAFMRHSWHATINTPMPSRVPPIDRKEHIEVLKYPETIVRVWVLLESQLVLQRRRADERVNAGLWDASAAGHVREGESLGQAAARELYEELGLAYRFPLQFLGTFVHGVTTNAIFMARFKGAVRLRPHPEEVAALQFVDPIAFVNAPKQVACAPVVVYAEEAEMLRLAFDGCAFQA